MKRCTSTLNVPTKVTISRVTIRIYCKGYRRLIIEGLDFGVQGSCIPKPYKIVGYDPLLRGSNPPNSRFLIPRQDFGEAGNLELQRELVHEYRGLNN